MFRQGWTCLCIIIPQCSASSAIGGATNCAGCEINNGGLWKYRVNIKADHVFGSVASIVRIVLSILKSFLHSMNFKALTSKNVC